jgi:hypothetical protein
MCPYLNDLEKVTYFNNVQMVKKINNLHHHQRFSFFFFLEVLFLPVLFLLPW